LKPKFLALFMAPILLAGSLLIIPEMVKPVQAAAATVVYDLYTTDGYVNLADGTAMYDYGFVGGREGQPMSFQTSMKAASNPGGVVTLPAPPQPTAGTITAAEQPLAGNAQLPAPIIYASTRDIVELRLKNLGVTNPTAPNDPHSIHLHGLDVNAANDGVPETSVGAVPANLCADGNTASDCSTHKGSAPGAGNVIVYMFAPKYPGTYMYHCHQEADIHVQMGMYGALVVYNPTDPAAKTGPGSGKGGTLDGWHYDKDYIMLLSEVDIRQHQSEEGTYKAIPSDPPEWNPVDYHPQYWMINGLSFPNTVHVDNAGFKWTDWITAHPGYDPFIQGSVSTKHPGTNLPVGDKVLIRVINMGFETQPMHMHGFHGKVIGSDQRAWTWANPPGTPWGSGLEKNTLTIGSGETYEWLINMGEQNLTSTYDPGTDTRYDTASNLPVSNTMVSKPAIPMPATTPAASTPYLGGPVVSGTVLGQDVGQYFPFHNHDDYKATNDGDYPGGMFTMIKTLP
jgi:FtsP/CotA-like multicopper oxidase with cupredoxin domain